MTKKWIPLTPEESKNLIKLKLQKYFTKSELICILSEFTDIKLSISPLKTDILEVIMATIPIQSLSGVLKKYNL